MMSAIRGSKRCVIAAMLLATSTAFAADPSPSAARQRFAAGAQLYAQGKYADAVDQFLAADRLSPSAALSFDIARAYEKLGETSLALRWYRDYLRRAGEPADAPKVRRTIDQLERELRSKGVQQVTVFSDPRGSTVAIDGEPAGVTPLTTDLPPGHHRLTLSHDGYDKAEQSFTLLPDVAMDVNVKLATATTPEAGAAAAAAPPSPTEPTPTAVTAPVPEATEERPSSSSKTLRTLGIIGMSAGGAALGGALAFEILRRDSVDEAKKDQTQVGYASKVGTANDRQTAARVLLGVGAGLAVTGGVLFVIGATNGHSRTEIALGCKGALCGAHASGRF